MENFGVSATNDPRVSLLWEQHGRLVFWSLVFRDGPPPVAPCLRLPTAEDPPP
jgi:hypothetical protein